MCQRQSDERQDQAGGQPRRSGLAPGCCGAAQQQVGAGRVLPQDVLTHGLDPCAVTAAAHKLARLIYTMLTKGQEYTDQGQEYYEARYRERGASGAVAARRQDACADGADRATGLKNSFQISHLGGVS
jgi:hypothetical protein